MAVVTVSHHGLGSRTFYSGFAWPWQPRCSVVPPDSATAATERRPGTSNRTLPGAVVGLNSPTRRPNHSRHCASHYYSLPHTLPLLVPTWPNFRKVVHDSSFLTLDTSVPHLIRAVVRLCVRCTCATSSVATNRLLPAIPTMVGTSMGRPDPAHPWHMSNPIP